MLTIRCRSRRPEWQTGDLPYSAPLTITQAWSIAGTQYGAVIGAAFGAVVIVFGGLWFVAPVGILVGVVIGTFVGFSVGVVNGLALTWLSRTRAWTTEPERRARRAAWTSAATTLLSVIALQLALFRSLGGRSAFVLLDTPGLIGAAIAAHLSRRLPPVQAHRANDPVEPAVHRTRGVGPPASA